MTVTTQDIVVTADGDGTSVDFVYGKPFDALDDLRMLVTHADGTQTVPTFNPTGDPASGATLSITGYIPAATDKMSIWRETELTQEVDYTRGAFPSAAHEKSADKIFFALQELQAAVRRAVRLPFLSSEIPEFADFEEGYSLVRTAAGFGKGPSVGEIESAAGAAQLSIAAKDEAVAARNLLTDLSINLTALPYGAEGYGDYDTAGGILNLFISAGPQGLTGQQGENGAQGIPGIGGPQGVIGPQGIQGEKGGIGNVGGVGEQGVPGIQGQKGDQGNVGNSGPQGQIGESGIQGVPGEQGAPGNTGQVGEKGGIGNVGGVGEQGLPGGTGDQGPVGDPGPMGSPALGLAFGRFYVGPDGMLSIEYYGAASGNDFEIDASGNLKVTVAA